MSPVEWTLLLWIGLAAGIVMIALWLLHLMLKDAGLVDVGWSLGLGASAVFLAIAADGDPIRRWIVGVLGGFWGFRLGVHLLIDRILSDEEDGRYQMLRERMGRNFAMWMLPFFEAQALTIVVLSLPFLLGASNPETIGWLDALGVAIWLIGIIGESIADLQLRRFKRDPESRGKTCRIGLWQYSRHPNYFFEWLMWCAYALIGIAGPFGWLSIIAPLMMLILILKITGIPPTEARAVRSRGEEYRRYQREVSAFVPWFSRTRQA